MDRPPDEPLTAVPEPPPRPDEDRTDLLAVGLLVFFVSLIGVVGALLLFPVLF